MESKASARISHDFGRSSWAAGKAAPALCWSRVPRSADKPVVFALHGYAWLIRRLTYRRTNHANLHVQGCKEEGTTATPSDVTVLNDLDRFHLAGGVVDRVQRLRLYVWGFWVEQRTEFGGKKRK